MQCNHSLRQSYTQLLVNRLKGLADYMLSLPEDGSTAGFHNVVFR